MGDSKITFHKVGQSYFFTITSLFGVIGKRRLSHSYDIAHTHPTLQYNQEETPTLKENITIKLTFISSTTASKDEEANANLVEIMNNKASTFKIFMMMLFYISKNKS